jgi:hypothetical protein
VPAASPRHADLAHGDDPIRHRATNRAEIPRGNAASKAEGFLYLVFGSRDENEAAPVA